MGGAYIDRVDVIDVRVGEPPGDDTVFIAVHALGETGWYGPVSDAIGNYVGRVLAPVAVGADATDHEALYGQLSGPALTASAAPASWAIGAVDCAAWDLHGRLTGRPVTDLLARTADASRSVPVYASWLTRELTRPVTAGVLSDVLAGGWAFTKWGLRCQRRDSPTVSGRVLARAAERAAETAGTRIAADAVGTWTPTLAHAFATEVDPAALV